MQHEPYGDDECDDESEYAEDFDSSVEAPDAKERRNWLLRGKKGQIDIGNISNDFKQAINSNFGNMEGDVTITSVEVRTSAFKKNDDDQSRSMTIETHQNYNRRIRMRSSHARQRCFVAGNFFTEIENGGIESFYGIVDKIYCVRVSVQQKVTELKLISVDWMYGLVVDEKSGVVYTGLSGGRDIRRETIQNKKRTIEQLDCVDRQIGYFDFRNRRYILDNRLNDLLAGEDMRLGGVALRRGH